MIKFILFRFIFCSLNTKIHNEENISNSDIHEDDLITSNFSKLPPKIQYKKGIGLYSTAKIIKSQVDDSSHLTDKFSNKHYPQNDNSPNDQQIQKRNSSNFETEKDSIFDKDNELNSDNSLFDRKRFRKDSSLVSNSGNKNIIKMNNNQEFINENNNLLLKTTEIIRKQPINNEKCMPSTSKQSNQQYLQNNNSLKKLKPLFPKILPSTSNSLISLESSNQIISKNIYYGEIKGVT